MRSSDSLLAELLATVQDLKIEILCLRDTVAGQPIHAEGWAEPRAAAAALRAEGVKSHKHLSKLRLDGAFTEGREIRNVSKGDRPTWEYHVPGCRKALQQHFKNLHR